MASETFQLVFKIIISHSYFKEGFDNSSQLTASDQTKILLQRFRIMMRTTPAGVDFFAPSTSSFSDLLDQIKTETSLDRFEFKLIVNDPNFFLYTLLPLKDNLSFFYSSENEDNEKLPGMVRMAPIQVERQDSFGKMHLLFKDLMHFENEPAQFNIAFSARSTRWDYYIINRSNLPLEGLTLDTQEDFAFEGPKAVTLDNGQDALWFTSGNQLLPLYEVPQYKFNLLTQLQGAGEGTHPQKVITGLPVPNLSNFRIYKENGIEGLSSPMYIYV